LRARNTADQAPQHDSGGAADWTMTRCRTDIVYHNADGDSG